IFCQEKKYIRYLLFFIIAVSFHVTGIVIITFPFMDHIAFKRKKVVVFIFLLIFFSFFGFDIVSIIMTIIPPFHWSIWKLNDYLMMGVSEKLRHSHIVSLSMILFYIVNFRRIAKINRLNKICSFYLLYFLGLSFCHASVLLFDRLYFYIQIFEPVLIIQYTELFKEKTFSRYLFCFLCLIWAMFTIFIWAPRNNITAYRF
ncbi:MAG: EpsG family protein, partial [Prevotella sp.]|nr:EpsG family protein [Prevotella sp.]